MSKSNNKEEEKEGKDQAGKSEKKARPDKYKEKLKIDDKDFDEVLKIASQPPKKKKENKDNKSD